LFLMGAAPLLLLSGGGTGPVSEAEIMRRMALARGVPDTALLVEPESRDTVENAREAARLLRSRGGRKVLLVSDRAHLPRAVLLFRLAGLHVAGWSGVPPPSIHWEVGAAVRECVALPRSLARALLARDPLIIDAARDLRRRSLRSACCREWSPGKYGSRAAVDRSVLRAPL